MEKQDLEQIKQIVQETVKEELVPVKDELNYIKQKMTADHQSVMAELAKIKKMETEDVNAFAGDVDNLKRRVTKLEKAVY